MSLNFNKNWLKSLLLECPFGSPRKKCPAKRLRRLSREGRIGVVESMPPHVIEEYLLSHKNCVLERETARREGSSRRRGTPLVALLAWPGPSREEERERGEPVQLGMPGPAEGSLG